ncbi:MAG: aldehyde ferredoxin oxidoreductase C-terminal domain-containing protein [Candidatus Bipolaricaulota bacterium]|nr:aldehyde ferredoxin oxidoreductase C-terminal domain-containing protein [Candidatus Bipolaricaulota bacterium]
MVQRILRVNMTDRTATFEEVPEKYKERAGRWLTSSIVASEVPPTCHPLGPKNKLVISAGLTSGTSSPTSARVSIGGKSPLTGTIKESNAGTGFAHMLARLRIKSIIIEGQPQDTTKYWTIKIDKNGPSFLPADQYVGLKLSEAYEKLFAEHGDISHRSILGIGVAGEYMLGAAGICFNDMEGHATRYSGRGGMGAVMGSKGLKFVILDDTDAPGVEFANKELFDQGRKKLADALLAHAMTKPKGALNSYGTAGLVNIINKVGGLPTRNFRSGRFEGATKVSGEALFANNKERTGKEVYNHACSPGCIIQCSNTVYRPDGSEHMSCLEYESDWAFGPNCGIDDIDTIAELVNRCNEYGLDTIEVGGALAVAMDGGLAEFGDGKRALEIVDEISKGTPLGRIIGSGAVTTGRAFGVSRVPAVKGQNMPAYEPRAIKGIGMTYAVSTMGADHTSGYTIATEVLGVAGKADPLNSKKAEMARNFQYATGFIDSSGHCLFIAFAILDIPSGFEGMIEECNGILGTSWTADDVGRIGKEVIDIERAFNRAAGFTSADDRLPEFMTYEPLPPHNAVWDITGEELDSILG